MATYTYDSLETSYGNFSNPEIVIKVNDKELTTIKNGFPVSDVVVDLTSGFEASVAEFSIYDAYDLAQNEFLFSQVKKYILLGSKVEIEMGYKKKTTRVFLGVITRVNFLFEAAGIPCIRVTAMDVKGVMMAGSYEKQLKATNYSDAVSEILKKTAYDTLQSSGIITGLSIQDTPDKTSSASSTGGLGDLTSGLDGLADTSDFTSGLGSDMLSGADSLTSGLDTSSITSSLTGDLTGSLSSGLGDLTGNLSSGLGDMGDLTGSLSSGLGDIGGLSSGLGDLGGLTGASSLTGATGTASAKTMEMVGESDYDFVVKAAKRNNYEFFTECGKVIFRKAKSDKTILMEIAPTMSMRSFDISYDISGIVNKVIVRGMDVSKAQVIKSEQKLSNKISQGNKAKNIIKGSEKVYVDSTVSSTEDAQARAASLAEQISYRYGTMTCELIGIPELLPGHFIKLYGLGTEPDNNFYLTRVKHTFDSEGRYLVTIEGVSASVEETESDSSSSLLGTASSLGGLSSLSSLTDSVTDLSGLSDSLSESASEVTSLAEGIGSVFSLF